MEIEITNKTARAFLMEGRDAVIKKMVEEFKEKFPQLSSWQISARIRAIILERIKEGAMPEGYRCDRATIANSMKRQGLYITKK